MKKCYDNTNETTQRYIEEKNDVCCNFSNLVWNKIPETKFEIMTNESGEIFIKYDGKKELRFTPYTSNLYVSLQQCKLSDIILY